MYTTKLYKKPYQKNDVIYLTICHINFSRTSIWEQLIKHEQPKLPSFERLYGPNETSTMLTSISLQHEFVLFVFFQVEIDHWILVFFFLSVVEKDHVVMQIEI